MSTPFYLVTSYKWFINKVFKKVTKVPYTLSIFDTLIGLLDNNRIVPKSERIVMKLYPAPAIIEPDMGSSQNQTSITQIGSTRLMALKMPDEQIK